MIDQHEVVCADGVKLAAYRHRAAGERRAVVLVTHAMMASSRYLDRPSGAGFASALAAAGLETWRLDFRGHGGSPAPAASFDDFALRDLPAAMAHVAGHAGVTPGDLVYMGHSLGGLVGLAGFGLAGPASWPAALVLLSSHLWRRDTASWRRRTLIGAWAVLTRLFGRMPAKLLRVGSEDVPGAYSRQFVGWARSGRWDSADGRDYTAAARILARPLLVVAGDRDRLCRPAEAREFVTRLGHTPELVVVPGADHFGLFDAARAAPAWQRVVDFTLRAAAARPGR